MHSDVISDVCIMMKIAVWVCVCLRACARVCVCVVGGRVRAHACGNVSVSDNCDQCMQQDPVTDRIP